MVRRDRLEKVATWEATARAVGLFLGHSTDAVNQVVGALKHPLAERITQEAYDIRTVQRKLRERLRKVRDEGRYMRMLDDMTVE